MVLCAIIVIGSSLMIQVNSITVVSPGIEPDDVLDTDFFGISVALYDNFAIVGSYTSGNGYAYIFKYTT